MKNSKERPAKQAPFVEAEFSEMLRLARAGGGGPHRAETDGLRVGVADSKARFVASMIRQGVLRFGEFQLKSGLRSPYFFNLGNVSRGAELGGFYVEAIAGSGLEFNVLFGPAYKGIPIAVATAIALAPRGRSAVWAWMRPSMKRSKV